MQKTDEDWRKKLTPQQYHILREKGTEAPFTGKFAQMHDDGMYSCAACGNPLFSSGTKFESGSGWPSFFDVDSKGSVVLEADRSLGLERTEVKCSNCGSHLGHQFSDGPKEKTGLRYCINSCALEFNSKSK